MEQYKDDLDIHILKTLLLVPEEGKYSFPVTNGPDHSALWVNLALGLILHLQGRTDTWD